MARKLIKPARAKPTTTLPFRFVEVDRGEQENDVLVFSIYSTGYLKQIHQFIKPGYFEFQYMRKIWIMIDNHFQKFGAAIGPEDFPVKYKSEVEPFFEKEVTNAITKGFLTKLSKEYENKELNPERIPYHVERALFWAQQRHKELWDAETQSLQEHGKEWEALIHATEFSTLATGETVDLAGKVEQVLMDSTSFVTKEIPPLREIIAPWLLEESLTMIFSKAGIGKSFLGLIISVLITRKKAVGNTIGPWTVMNPAGVLYLDGEMSQQDLQERIRGLSLYCGEEDREEHPLTLLSADIFAKEYKTRINLAQEEWRDLIYKILADKFPRYEVLVIDNIGSLIPGGDENVKAEWDPINQWFLSLRHLGISVIFEHHAGKGGTQRGTSGREDNINNTIVLTKPEDYTEGEGARFNVSFEKSRRYDKEGGFYAFELRVVNNSDGSLSWETNSVRERDSQRVVMALLGRSDLKQNEIAQLVGITPSAVTQIKDKAVRQGFMDKDRALSDKGKEELEKVDLTQYE